uniref:DNA-directed RNA polymerase I subunit RPA49 n=1 Tax=Anopheles epiroticus TaxID=199890 RepID=A0A182PNQ6_9DIPT
MSGKIVSITGQSPRANHPIVLENFETYLEPHHHDMKCLLARDPTLSKVAVGVGNTLLVSGEKKLYIGQVNVQPSEALASPPADLLRTYVACRNKQTGKMRLYEVRSSTMMHISQNRPLDGGKDVAYDMRQLARMRAKFNSRAGRKQLNLMNKQMNMSVMEEKLERTLAETVLKESPAATALTAEGGDTDQAGSIGDVMQRELHAIANTSAKSLADLYRAERLIGADEWRNLLEPARQLLQLPAEELQMANAYLENKVKAAMQSSEPMDEQNLATARTCLYMDVLSRLMGRKGYQLASGRGSLSPFTRVLDGPIRQGFLQPVRRETSTRDQVTKYTRIKALMYYMALAFAMEGRDRMDVQTLHQSLEVPREQLLLYGRIVGARHYPKTDQFMLGTVQSKGEANPLADVLATFRTGAKRMRQN